MKVTQWFSWREKPARPGFYQRDYPDKKITTPDYWNGAVWFAGYWCEIENRLAVDTRTTLNGPLNWRGLAEKPGDSNAKA